MPFNSAAPTANITAIGGISVTSFAFPADNISSVYNFTVNNTDSGYNITAVYVFAFNNKTYLNRSTGGVINSSLNLGFNVSTATTGDTTIINFTTLNIAPNGVASFWFALKPFLPFKGGNISVMTILNNMTAVFLNQSNLTVHINDTYKITFHNLAGSGIGTNWTGINLSWSSFIIEVNLTGNESGSASARIELYNNTGRWQRNSTNNLGTNVTAFYINYSALPEDLYFVNVTVNNSIGDTNSTSFGPFRLDRTGPTITITATNSTKNYIGATISFSDDSKIKTTCSVDRTR